MSYSVQLDPLFRVRVYTHFFKITKVQPGARAVIEKFMLKFAHQGFRPNENSVSNNDKIYAERISDGSEYRFHRGQYADFEKHIEISGLSKTHFIVEYQPLADPKPMTSQMKPGWATRGQQAEAVDFVCNRDEFSYHSKLVTAPPGAGKTIIAGFAATRRKFRAVLIVLPGYMEKWLGDITKMTDTPAKGVMMVSGGQALRGLIAMGKEETFDSDWTIISLTTWVNFLKAYNKDPLSCTTDDYGCAPEEVYELLGLGTAVIDEIHQQLYGVYKTTTYMHIDTLLGLSGTFLSNDPFIEGVQKMVFPREMRFANIKPSKHIAAYGISYAIRPESLRKIKITERGSSTYSQTAFEKSILKHADLRKNYMRLVEEVFDNGFMDQYKPGDKAILFARTTAMCTAIVDHIKTKYPKLDTRKYTMEDPFENIIDADVRVTTQQSGGTAIDIPNLKTNITTDNIRSPQANLQCIGRLRDTDDGTVPRYYAVYSESVQPHCKYHAERRKLFSDRVKTFKEFQSRVAI